MNKGRWLITAAMILLIGLAGLMFVTYRNAATVQAEGPFGVPFTLVAQDGSPITEKAFTGKPSAVFFGYTHCPDVCPTTLFELDGWLKKVDPDKTLLNAYFVSVDPERDTPDLMRQYVSNVSDRITGISGPGDKVREMVKGFRVYFKKVPQDAAKPEGDYTMDHTASIFLLDRQGRFAGTIAYQEDADVAMKKLQNLIASKS